MQTHTKGPFALGYSDTEFWRCQPVVRNGLHCHQCNCSHMTTEKSIVVAKCEWILSVSLVPHVYKWHASGGTGTFCGNHVDTIGGSKSRTRTPHRHPNSLDFIQLSGKYNKIVCWRPLPPRVGVPNSGKSWIHHRIHLIKACYCEY